MKPGTIFQLFQEGISKNSDEIISDLVLNTVLYLWIPYLSADTSITRYISQPHRLSRMSCI